MILFPDGKFGWHADMIAARLIDPPNGEWLTVIPLALNRARVCIATPLNASLEHW